MSQKQILATLIALLGVVALIAYGRRPVSHATSPVVIPTIVKKWEFTAGGKIYGALALADDGTIYAPSEDGFVYALDASGTLQWKTYIGPSICAPAIGTDGAIYIPTNNGRVFALNPSGGVRWAADVYDGNSWGKNGSALGRDYLYAASRGGLSAVRLANGQVDWQSMGGSEQWGSITLLPDGTLFAPGRGRLSSLDSHGEILWQHPALTPEALRRNGNFPPPGDFFVVSGIAVDSNHTLYAAVDRTRLVALGLDGSPKWELQTDSAALNRATPVISADGAIFFGSGDATFYALDSFGTTKWTLRLDGPLVATPVLAQDGSIFVVSGRLLSTISPDGHVLSHAETGYESESSPTLARDGTLYVATVDGRVIAFAGGHGGLMDSPWPKYQADLSNSGTPRTF